MLHLLSIVNSSSWYKVIRQLFELIRNVKCSTYFVNMSKTILVYYQPQEKVMFSQPSVILSTIGLMDTRSLLILVTARSVRILLECFLVYKTNDSLTLLLPFITALNVDVTYHGNSLYEMVVNGNRYMVTGSLYETGDKNKLTCTINGVRSSANVVHNGDSLHIFSSVSSAQF